MVELLLKRVVGGLVVLAVLGGHARAAGSLEEARAMLSERAPGILEAKARLRAVQEETVADEAAPVELHGSYFYYPNARVGGEELSPTLQRADLFVRYPLVRGYFNREHDRAIRVAREAEAEAELARVAGSEEKRLSELYVEATRAAKLSSVIESLREDTASRIQSLRNLWEQKLVLLEEVLSEEAFRARLDAEKSKEHRRGQAALIGMRELLGDPEWIPVPLSLEDVSFPVGLPARGPLPSPWENRARTEKLLARPALLPDGARLDLEAGYVWEEDESAGFQSGPRVGVRMSIPLGRESARAREASHRALTEAWLARHRAEAARAKEEQSDVWEALGDLRREGEILSVESRRLDEIVRVRSLRGQRDDLWPDRAFLLLRQWDVYFRAMLSRERLSVVSSGEGGPEALRFSPPARANPALRKSPPRAVYVWGGAEAVGQPEDFLRFCEAKGIEQALLSPAGKPIAVRDEKWRALLLAAKNRGVKLALLLGENKWVVADRRAGLYARLKELEGLQAETEAPFQTLHLDVEPHALPEWGDHAAALTESYLSMIEDVRTRLSGFARTLRLEVSVPSWFSKHLGGEGLRRLGAVVDRTVVMTYGTNRPARIVAALEPWAGLPSVGLALRAADFGTEAELERVVREVSLREPWIRSLTLHDLKGWRELAATEEEVPP
ncbi:MAG: hypothetical protein HY900_10215 [Deltaproteobacteria bacterium]|nr:hypothetical protein [Deltaproteobacteria bacterium]